MSQREFNHLLTSLNALSPEQLATLRRELDSKFATAAAKQTIIQPSKKWGEGILRTAGALADDPYWDAIMEQIHQSRKVERRSQGVID